MTSSKLISGVDLGILEESLANPTPSRLARELVNSSRGSEYTDTRMAGANLRELLCNFYGIISFFFPLLRARVTPETRVALSFASRDKLLASPRKVQTGRLPSTRFTRRRRQFAKSKISASQIRSLLCACVRVLPSAWNLSLW